MAIGKVVVPPGFIRGSSTAQLVSGMQPPALFYYESFMVKSLKLQAAALKCRGRYKR
jgi:hypothetical protein